MTFIQVMMNVDYECKEADGFWEAHWKTMKGLEALVALYFIIGSEFKWGTFKTVFIHQPKRLNVLEGMISGAAAQSEVIENIARVLPGVNADSLANTFIPSFIKDIAIDAIDIVDGTQAIFVLIAYAAGFPVLTGLFIQQRDIIK
ncbi:hypothetical protein KFZ56_05455 [Virgibacillus sp. NKC19-3]|uniref:hypothetical protein n=1 Tax=Virgibacillus saliphilus TaxID=2831674 RepID=UPI001C9AE056|nr:hypothetical protein [Virgibacillus sp. NKC19-3]MBY7142533.1 hypothetical protein [Virgibacillus sp. NKC19-3]